MPNDATDYPGGAVPALPSEPDRFSAIEADARFQQPGWDGYGAAPLDRQCIEAARRFLASVSVVPCCSGGVQLEWHTLGADLEVEFDPGEPVFFWLADAGSPHRYLAVPDDEPAASEQIAHLTAALAAATQERDEAFSHGVMVNLTAEEANAVIEQIAERLLEPAKRITDELLARAEAAESKVQALLALVEKWRHSSATHARYGDRRMYEMRGIADVVTVSHQTKSSRLLKCANELDQILSSPSASDQEKA